MRRIALILLVLLLPLQSIWAAAAHACPHESASAGHYAADAAHAHAHDLAHERAGTAATTDDGSADAGSERDSAASSTCHGQGNAAVLGDDLVAVTVAVAGVMSSPYARFVADRFLESPLRPPVLQR
ncbi:MAG: hypothetical protein Q8L49_07605 [Burkholderiaceae bacterium]|nr:hypothetical protein [Burkholderiaceae bacterium]